MNPTLRKNHDEAYAPSGRKKSNSLYNLIILASILGSQNLKAVTVATYDIPTSTTTITTVSGTGATGVIVGNIDKGSGLTLSSSSSGWRATSYNQTATTSTAISNANSGGDFWSFSLGATSSYNVTLNGIGSLSFSTSGSGPTAWALLYSSSSAFSSFNTLATYTGVSGGTVDVASSWTTALAAAPVSIGAGTTGYFRIVGYGASSTSGTGGIVGNLGAADFTLLGDIQALAAVRNLLWNGGNGNWGNDQAGWSEGGQNYNFTTDSSATINSAGTLTVTNAGVTAGKVTVGNATGDVVVAGGNLTGTYLDKNSAGNLTLSNKAIFTLGVTNSAGTSTMVDTLTVNAGGLTVSGGKVVLNASNSITGGVSLTGGTLVANHEKSLGAGTVAMNGGSLEGGVATITNAVTLGVSGGTVTNSSSLNLSGSVTGAGNTLSKRGSGDLNLSGAVGASGGNGIALNLQEGQITLSGNTTKYVGNATLNGILVLSNAGIFTRGSTFGGTGQVQISGNSQWSNNNSQSYITNAVVMLPGVNLNSSNASSSHLHLLGGLSGTGNVTTAGAGGLYIYGSSFSGEITNNSSGDLRLLNTDVSGITAYRGTNTGGVLMFSNSTQNRVVGGLISGAQSLYVRGDKVTTFTNLSSDFTNAININGSGNTATAKFVGTGSMGAIAGGEISLGSTNNILHLDGVASQRNIGFKTGGGTITVDGDSTLGGITNNTSGGQLFTKNGSGKLTFTGLVRDDVSTNAPIFNIQAGRVTLGASSSTAQYININGTTNLYTGDLELLAGNQVSIQGSGTMGGGGLITLTGNDAALQTSSTSSNDGATLTIANDVILNGSVGTKASIAATTSNIVVLNRVLGTGDLYFGTQGGGGGGVIALKQALSHTGNVVMNMSTNGVIRLDAANILGNAGVVMYRSNTAGAGSGILDLNGKNQAAAFLQSLSNNAAHTGTITSATAATLTLNQNVDTTYGGTVDGALAIVKNGSGSLRLDTGNTYAGGTTLNEGSLFLGSSTALGTGQITVNGGILASAGTSRILANAIALNSDLILGGQGYQITLNGNLDLGGAGRTLTINNSAIVGGIISNGALTINSTNTSRSFTITNGATYAGGTTVQGGRLALSGAGTLAANGALNIAAGTTNATFDISGLSGAGTTIGSLAGGSAATVELSGKTLSVGGNNNSTTFAGGISGTGGGLVKNGSGTMTLSGSNTYTGATTVDQGTLQIASEGSISSSAASVNNGAVLDVQGTAGTVTVNNGGRLEGSGSVGALTVASGGTLAVGNSPGTMTASSATWESGGIYSWEFNSIAGNSGSSLAGQGINWDFLNVSGVLDITAASGSPFIIDIVSLLAAGDTSFDQDASYSFAIATAAGGITNFLASDFNITGYLSGSNKWSLGLVNNTGSSQSLVLSYNAATAIPEPSTGGLLVIGLGLVAAFRRKRKV